MDWISDPRHRGVQKWQYTLIWSILQLNRTVTINLGRLFATLLFCQFETKSDTV
jgi:hypothetical protein